MSIRQNETGSNENIQAQLEELTTRLEQLRVRYEQYFIGVERRAPTQLRRDVARMMYHLEHIYISNTAQKFHFRSLSQRFRTYTTYWNRTLREIEEGTYRRHRQRAQRREERYAAQEAARSAAQRDAASASTIDLSIDETLDAFGDLFSSQDASPESVQAAFDLAFNDALAAIGGASDDLVGEVQASADASSARPARQAAPPAPPPRAQAAPPARDGRRALYDEFMTARDRCGQRSAVDYTSFERSLDRQTSQVRSKHPDRDVSFKVVVKDGKPFLQPVIKR